MLSLEHAIIAALLGTLFLGCHRVVRLQGEVNGKQSEISATRAQLSDLESEFRDELGEMIKVLGPSGKLGSDFSYRIFDEKLDQETVRFIKIQCPGVRHADIFVNIIFNGCVVTVRRQASKGVEQVTWEKRFQFRPSDGLFEFKEDQALLDQGYLQLVFRAYAFQTRVFRFPQHFNLSETDTDRTWVFPADAAGGGIRASPPSMLETAPGRLELTGEELQPCERPPRSAETSASPIDTEDIEDTQIALGAAAAAAVSAEPAAPTISVAPAVPQGSAYAASEFEQVEPAVAGLGCECASTKVADAKVCYTLSRTPSVEAPGSRSSSAGGFEKVANVKTGRPASSSSAASSSGFAKVEKIC